MREIDYDIILRNTEEMINALEYDGMRSHGKMKFNANDLYFLYSLKDRYKAMIKGAKAQDSTDTRKKAKAVAEG